ncbi:Uncharacterized protein GBIM_06153 [Gryllus bimaculatus]|nr:Uncharacterized protein GBIM_06153 [Gryllus bimaculatus]
MGMKMSSSVPDKAVQDDSSTHNTWVRFEDEDRGQNRSQTERVQPSQGNSSILSGEEYSVSPLKTENVREPRANSPEKLSEARNEKEMKAVPTGTPQYSGAIINPETVHVNLDRSSLNRSTSVEEPQQESFSNNKGDGGGRMRNVDLREVSNGRPTASSRVSAIDGSVRQGFANGDIIVTLLPVNTRWPWITPAQFRPELVPEELMAQGLTLTVEEYVHVMEVLTNDVRFNIYNVCYKRILVVWIFTAFVVLLGLLFSGVTGLTLFGLGVMWLVLNALAIFLCMWIKIKKKLQEVIEREECEGRPVNREETAEERRQRQQFQQRMDIEDHDIIIQGSSTTRLSRKQARGEQLLARYLQRWAKDYLRRRLDWTVDESGGNPMDPRHLARALCPCQYIEEYLRNKPRSDQRAFCPCCASWLAERGID